MSSKGKPIHGQKRLNPAFGKGVASVGQIAQWDGEQWVGIDADLIAGEDGAAGSDGATGPAGPGASKWAIATIGAANSVTIPWADVDSGIHAFLFSWVTPSGSLGNLYVQSVNTGVEFTVSTDASGSATGSTFLWVAFDTTASP